MAPTHENYMKRCLEIAQDGLGFVSPNPMVGSVIVHNDRIIGEGYHKKFGGPHAEVNAINSVTNPELLSQSTLYVNLEPCSHQGKTPPCTDLIIENRISRVVISNVDPHKMVMGKGIQKLRDAGIDVITDVLKKEGDELNRRFFTFHRKFRPYIILKWAQTADGFIDRERDNTIPQKPTWITNEQARMLVHKWRSEEQSILVGTNTVFLDNPKLNVRDWVGNNPVRILIDRRLRLPRNLNLFDGSSKTLVFTECEEEESDIKNLDFITVEFDEYLPEHILGELWRRNILSVIIEGGTKTLQTFINAGLWDEARVFTGNKYFINGIKAPIIENIPLITETKEDFKLDIFRN
jgi:diaminohydroxyphosphoribosylaminopyrimidine deaminase/5-amino-6-(5-phosphoribosylamino)uracil reductase